MRIDFYHQMAIYIISASTVLLVTLFLFIKGRKTPLLYSFIVFQSFIFLWLLRIILLKIGLISSAEIFHHLNGTTFEFYEFQNYKTRYFIVWAMGLCWLIFSLIYTENPIIHKKKLASVLLLSLIIFHNLVIFRYTKPLRLTTHKISLFMLITSCYIYYFIGIGLLVKKCFLQNKYLKYQSLLLCLGILVPVLLNYYQDYKRHILFMGGIIYNFDIVPLGFVLTMLIIVFVTCRYRFLDVTLIAFHQLAEHISEGMIFIDPYNYVISCNKGLRDIFEYSKELKINSHIKTFLEDISSCVINPDNYQLLQNCVLENTSYSIKTELILNTPKTKYISVHADCLTKGKKVIGKILCFSDVTEYKNLVNTISEKNDELTLLNIQLKEYASVAEELAITKERNRLTREIHDTLGHTMTVLISLLEAAAITSRQKDTDTYKRIKEATDIARDGLQEVRRSVIGLSPGKLEDTPLLSALEKLIDSFNNLGVHIELTAPKLDIILEPSYAQTIYRVLQESITNSIRHGHASTIDIILKCPEDKLKIFIIDDGCGCKYIKKGLGLSGMEQRVKQLNGTISFGSDGEKGFTTRIELPIS